jgi:hypothetical protein
MDAWESRHGEQRAAAIDRLEQLCIEKHHLKMPSAATNVNSKSKKKNVDVSQLKAPTPSFQASTLIEDAQHPSLIMTSSSSSSSSGEQLLEKLVKTPGKLVGLTVKPHGIKSGFSPNGNGKRVTSAASRSKSLSSPEPMSTGGDSERSRSTSPVVCNIMDINEEQQQKSTSTSTSKCVAQQQPQTADNNATNTTTQIGENENQIANQASSDDNANGNLQI